ncbi:MAG: hypothetical protein DRP01_02475 [Archaeoglobales archaeon]|nr:MAG: hypothetical protein DRP01_02475 [Archaeoglobales archaeon]
MPLTEQDVEEFREMVKAWMDKILARSKEELEKTIRAMPGLDEAERASILQKEMDRKKMVLSLLCANEAIKLSIPSAERLLDMMPSVIKAVVITTSKDATGAIATNIHFLAECGFVPGEPELHFLTDLFSHATVYSVINSIPRIIEGLKALLWSPEQARKNRPEWFGVV